MVKKEPLANMGKAPVEPTTTRVQSAKRMPRGSQGVANAKGPSTRGAPTNHRIPRKCQMGVPESNGRPNIAKEILLLSNDGCNRPW